MVAHKHPFGSRRKNRHYRAFPLESPKNSVDRHYKSEGWDLAGHSVALVASVNSFECEHREKIGAIAPPPEVVVRQAAIVASAVAL